MTAVCMTNAAGLTELPGFLERMSGHRAVERVFLETNIPLEIVGEESVRLPFASLTDVFERSGRLAMDRTFGLQVGSEYRPGNMGLWVKYALQAPTLADALARAFDCIKYYQDGAGFRIVPAGTDVIIRYVLPAGGPISVHHCDSVLTTMVRFFNSFLGPQWSPQKVELPYSRDRDAAQVENWFGTEVSFGAKGVGVALSRDLLKVNNAGSRAPSREIRPTDVKSSANDPGHPERTRSIREIMTMRLFAGQSDIEGVAEFARTSVRTLQRELSEDGLSYRQLLDEAKLERATSLLLDSRMPVTQIAFSLGYSDSANFSRFFKSRTGRSPQAFRQQPNPPAGLPSVH